MFETCRMQDLIGKGEITKDACFSSMDFGMLEVGTTCRPEMHRFTANATTPPLGLRCCFYVTYLGPVNQLG